MYSCVWTAALQGVEALPVKVECHAAKGLPKIVLSGLPDNAIREAITRIFSATRLSGIPLTLDRRFVINLVPGDLRKSGSTFDLPIALGMLAASGLIPAEGLQGGLVLGELGLDGRIEPVRGVLSLVSVEERKIAFAMVPEANRAEALAGCVHPVASPGSLREALLMLRDSGWSRQGKLDKPAQEAKAPVDLAVVRGQQLARRALEIAATGGHNLLMVGSPGSGKTLLARCLPGILPELQREERLSASRIHSVAGLLPPRQGLLSARPFRAPHATISDAGLVGSGRSPHVGEISLAHNGVLFLDELPQFRRSVLEQLRQPLEDGRILISRAGLRLELPSRFSLIAAMNPCPCGMFGDSRRRCSCSPLERQRYLSRISGPVLDRIDLQVQVPALDRKELLGEDTQESSTVVRSRVIEARGRQLLRNEAQLGRRGASNASLEGVEIRRICTLNRESQRLLEKAIDRDALSGRSLDRVLKVARTIADLEGRESLELAHLAEALLLKTLDAQSMDLVARCSAEA